MGLLELFTSSGIWTSGRMPGANISYLAFFFHAFFTGNWRAIPLTVMSFSVWVLVVLAGLLVVGLFVSTVAQGALIYLGARSTALVKIPTTSAKAWHVGVRFFSPLLVINLLKKVILLVVGLCVVWLTGYAAIAHSALISFATVIVYILAFIIGMIVSFLAVYTGGYVVVGEYRLKDAIVAAWNMFCAHWLVSLEVGAILLLCNVLLGFFALFSFFFFVIPALIFWVIGLILHTSTLFLIAFFVCTISFLLFVIFLGSLFTVFSTTTWTYLFMHMHEHGIVSRLLAWAGKKNG